MATLDARKQFGSQTSGVGPVGTMSPAKLTPTVSIDAATIPALANAQLAETVADTMEKVRKAGIVNDELTLKARYAEADLLEQQDRMDQERVQQEKGVMWSDKELQDDMNQRRAKRKSYLDSKYSVTWLGDEVSKRDQLYDQQIQTDYVGKVVYPRQRKIAANTLINTLNTHVEAAATAADRGDMESAIGSLRKAYDVVDSGPALIALGADGQIAQKKKLMNEDWMKIAGKLDPGRVLELIGNSQLLRQNAANNPDDQQAQAALYADPLRGFSDGEVASMKLDFNDAKLKFDEHARREKNRKEAEAGEKMQWEVGTQIGEAGARGDMKTLLGLQRQIRAAGQAKYDNPDSDGPGLNTYTALANRIQSEIEQTQRRAEAAAERAERRAERNRQAMALLGSDEVIDPKDAKSVKAGEAQAAIVDRETASLPPAARLERRLDFARKKGWIPKSWQREITQGAQSENPDVRKQAITAAQALQSASPRAYDDAIGKDDQYILRRVQDGVDPKRANEELNRDRLRSPEEKKILEESSKKALKDGVAEKELRGTVRGESTLGFGGKADTVPVEAQAQWQRNFEAEYNRTGGDADAAKRYANGEAQRIWSVDNSSGKAVMRKNQPVNYGMKPEVEKQVDTRILTENGVAPGVPYKKTNVGVDDNGTPLYVIEVFNKAGTASEPLKKPDGTVKVFRYDPKDAAVKDAPMSTREASNKQLAVNDATQLRAADIERRKEMSKRAARMTGGTNGIR